MYHAASLSVTDELAHEESCLMDGVVEYRKRVVINKTRSSETLSDYGKSLLGKVVEPLSTGLTDFIAATKVSAGRKHQSVKFLELIDPDVAAVLTARAVFDGMSQRKVYQYVATAVGFAIEDELRFAAFEQQNKKLYKRVNENLDESSEGFKRNTRKKVMVYAMNKFNIVWEKWSQDTVFHVGSKMIDLLVTTTGLMEIQRLGENKTARIYVVPTQELLGFITDFTNQSELLHPALQPMLIPPAPWTSITDGGYYHDSLRRKVRLVKTQTKGIFEELRRVEMPAVYAGVNNLQATAWRINEPILNVFKEALDAGLKVKGLPSELIEPLPPKPVVSADTLQGRAAWAEYKKRAGEIGRRILAAASKATSVARVKTLAEKYVPHARIYFPMRLDFRGRVYYAPTTLNPQGADLSKALLTFADAKPLGEQGAWWLGVHVANNFGFDKVSLQDRHQWTVEHSDRIVSMANDPLADLWWTEAEKPWQFLAACIEWVGFVSSGPEHECSLPILVDGSCNGLQHFAAMLRDEVTGKHVNLVPLDKPGDIYAEVAKHTEAQLRTYLSGNATDEEVELAGRWLDYGIDRNLCKRPVMVLPYGGTRQAVLQYIEAHVYDPENPKENPFGKRVRKHSIFLSNIIWEVMKSVVVGPRQAMDWLQKVAGIASKEDFAVTWTAPSGFLVQQRYTNTESRRVETRIGDKVMKFSLQSHKDGIDKRRQSMAVAPNYVHSLDAAALMLTVNACSAAGVGAFMAIHDSYGTHAGDMNTLALKLREEFVSMYMKDDVLARFADEITEHVNGKPLPPPPAKGKLDLGGVLRSDFFFS